MNIRNKNLNRAAEELKTSNDGHHNHHTFYTKKELKIGTNISKTNIPLLNNKIGNKITAKTG